MMFHTETDKEADASKMPPTTQCSVGSEEKTKSAFCAKTGSCFPGEEETEDVLIYAPL